MTTIDNDTRAAKSFYREVRNFAIRTKPWQTQISYETTPDEAHDFSLVSQRVYGRRDEFLAVMAAAGLNHFDDALPQMRLTLPTEGQLMMIKRQTGFESISDYREDGSPTWIES